MALQTTGLVMILPLFARRFESFGDGVEALGMSAMAYALASTVDAGPNLHGVFGREAGSKEGFTYSQALQDANFTWDASHLDHWLANPQTALPGNRMAFAGVRDETQRRDVIAYLMVEAAEQP